MKLIAVYDDSKKRRWKDRFVIFTLITFFSAFTWHTLLVKKLTTENSSLFSFTGPRFVFFHLFFPFNTESNHFSYQTFLAQYARRGNCFCLMFMYCGKRGSHVVEARPDWWSGLRERDAPKKGKWRKREIFRGNNLRWWAEQKEL